MRTLWFLTVLALRSTSSTFIQVPCLQTYGDFLRNWEEECTEPCKVVCHGACSDSYTSQLVTGYLYYTDSTPICMAALFQGAIGDQGGSFNIRSSGEMSRFVSGVSEMDGTVSHSSNSTHPSWFIEPYERVRFLLEPEDTTVFLGEYLTLSCLVNSRSRALVTWFNNGREVEWSTTVDCTGEVCQVQHAEKSHGGTWWCEVGTDYSGTFISRHVTVTVAYLNSTFIYQPKDLHRAYSSGGLLQKLPDLDWPLVLPCYVDSSPPALVTWYKNNRLISQKHIFQIGDGSLYFMTVDDTDSGSYKCKGFNTITNDTIESESKQIQRDAQASRPGPVPSSIISSITSNTIIATPGDTVTLTCVARGNPIPAISWSAPSTVQGSSRASSPSFARHYIVRDVRTSDSGEYKCRAENENDYGFGSSYIFKVLVVTRPTFSIVPSDKTFNKGDKGELRCGLQNRGSINWLKNGRFIKLNSRISLNSDYLVIKDISTRDEGMYQCVAGYVYGKNKYVSQSSAYLSVRSSPLIDTGSTGELLRNAGEVVHLRCSCSGYPYPYVTWYKNGEQLELGQRIEMVDIQRIKIKHAVGTDYGEYMCVAKNSMGTDTLTRTLTVIVKANIKSLVSAAPRGFYITGDSISLTCTAEGSKTVDVSWTKDNSKQLGLGVIVRQDNILDLYDYVVRRSVLEIPSQLSNTEHTGSYRCQVKNYLGGTHRDLVVRVYPTAIPPKLMSGPINTVISDENNMLINCIFTGAPPPTVTWLKDDKPITEDRRMAQFYSEDGLTSNLMIREAVRADSGNYSCLGTNIAGVTQKGVLPVSIHYSDEGGVRNGTNSTQALFTFPFLILLLLLL